MKVLFITREFPPFSVGGIGRRIQKLRQRLSENGITCDVVALGDPRSNSAGVSFVPCHDPIYFREGRKSMISNDFSVLTDIWRLNQNASELLKQDKYDIVQVEEPLFGPFVNKHGKHMITTIHHTRFGEYTAMTLRSLQSFTDFKLKVFHGTLGQILDRKNIRKADLFVTVTRFIRNEIITRHRIDPSRIHVVPNGVDVPAYVNKEDSKKSLGIDRLLAIHVGRLIPRKNIEVIIKAAQLAKNSLQHSLRIRIIGDGPQKAYLCDLVKHLDLDKFVEFTGRLSESDLAKYLGASDIILSSSFYEGGQSLSLLEGMAYDCFPIASDIPATRELITDEINGFLFPPNDADALAKRMSWLVENDKTLKILGGRAKETSKLYDWRITAEKMIECYRSIPNCEAR